jgi:hypothetical protein
VSTGYFWNKYWAKNIAFHMANEEFVPSVIENEN